MCSVLFASQPLGGVVHDQHSNDFPTYCLRLQPRDYAPLIMQAAEPDVARFVGSGAEVQVAMVHEALTRSIDTPLVLTLPRPAVAMLPFKPLILTAASASGRLDDDIVLGLCNVVHIPVPQVPSFVFKHDSMDPASYECAMLVVPRSLPPAPASWRQWVTMASSLDAHFGIDAGVSVALASCLDYILQCTYDEEAAGPQSPVRIFLHRTHFAAHFAFAYIHNILATKWMMDKTQDRMLPYLRAMLLARMLVNWGWPNPDSTLADFRPQKFMLISGIPLRTNVVQLQHRVPLEQFRAKMLELQSAGT